MCGGRNGLTSGQGCQIRPAIGPDWHQVGQIWDFTFVSTFCLTELILSLRFVLIGTILGQNLTSLCATTDAVTVPMVTR